uniref:Cytoplasmic tRNA 2-thiolation protein 1 n=1 Tax=Rhodosorus marinus TaxID=101924 RepID=A0A7S3EKL8_9RHOD|mmetsp:Transcript_41146/g.162481  ORF Transcript_41146/g.162481 Transcript_41146/m.162481 type:complete len:310 (+) Transcript_41146:229-1158(+)|eukprot:CAMPEP_0113963988 /NCGR_PEP_ID=MMETSP0011_2-20120614/6846_1 /TAXON_ID=101924 /ORGANISM="Rhodosorus marinus" /LENGTH=309 /DNA_ID=CAMNT_0000976153 /DNA_START=70 /DNA_END=999 /DNA_ORIENTATION=+ /assembly_acc=CAM_ASM_000156
MAPKLCVLCSATRACLRRPKTSEAICKECFFSAFEGEIHETIVNENLFKPGEKIAVGASGGKDSTVLAHVLKLLNERYEYGLDLFLVSVDEGIKGYRDDSLEAVKRNKQEYELPLKIVSYSELYGWTMDQIVEKIGKRSNCTYCGVFRRQALDRGAEYVGADKIATGHNADDIAETVIMNFLRGDFPRLIRCSEAITGDSSGDSLPRVKPFKYTYEKEIVLYAHYKSLDYFATECIYSPEAFRGHARQFIKDIEVVRARSIVDTIRSAEKFRTDPQTSTGQKLGACVNCGYMTSQKLCKACVLRQTLEG